MLQQQAKTGRRLYVMGFLLSIISLAGAELIWLPAPVRTSWGAQWIELIDWLYYLIVLIPLIWAAGAASGLRAPRNSPAVVIVIRVMIIAVSLLLAVGVLMDVSGWITAAIAGGAVVVVLIIADLAITEVRARSGFPWRSSFTVTGIALALCALLVPTGYNVTYPGMTLNLNRYAHIAGGYAGGEINGVLVFDRPAVLADRLFGALLPQYRFYPIPEDEPPLSVTYAQVVAMKTDANRVAAAIAMEKAGAGQGVIADGVRIVAIVKDSPADGKLEAGDIVDQLNEVTVRTVEEMIGYMSTSVKPGETVAVTLRRGGEAVTVNVQTKAAQDAADKAVFGVSVQTEPKLDTPRSIVYNDYRAHVGGPSHGAMLTLAFIDQLVAGGVTGGLRVAGTGTIELDGSIGMVGGIPQKAYAVSRTDVDVFFVPMEGERAAKAAAPKLNVVGVSHIDEVLAWLSDSVTSQR
ncbi:PDZ domain-containing protein [Paenibacillus sp. PL2-23]|uniref:PDZ domain-containing protein n=1 Tax=Paenibacillus sp. PL2-23 TaxID=2100729 RepID=UPI0030F64131